MRRTRFEFVDLLAQVVEKLRLAPQPGAHQRVGRIGIGHALGEPQRGVHISRVWSTGSSDCGRMRFTFHR